MANRWFVTVAMVAIAWSATGASGARAQGSSGGHRVLLAAGTDIPVHLVGTLNSGSAKADETFAIQAAQDVVVDGMVVVRKGSAGEGHVVETDSAGGNGHSGSLKLAFDYIYAVDGHRIRLSDSAQTHAEEDRKGASSTATIVGYATLGLGGLFAHNFAHGRQKNIDPATLLSSFVAENAHVVSTEKAESPVYDH